MVLSIPGHQFAKQMTESVFEVNRWAADTGPFTDAVTDAVCPAVSSGSNVWSWNLRCASMEVLFWAHCHWQPDFLPLSTSLSALPELPSLTCCFCCHHFLPIRRLSSSWAWFVFVPESSDGVFYRSGLQVPHFSRDFKYRNFVGSYFFPSHLTHRFLR